MSETNPTYSVVIPVYNSEKTVAVLYERLEKVFAEMGMPFEAIFVNDASSDGSAKVCEQLSDTKSNVVFVDLLRNFGQQNALLCGMSQCRGDFVITIDDDLQNPPEEIPKLVSTLADGNFEVVYGSPIAKHHQKYRNLGSDIVHLVLSRLFTAHKGKAASFRIMTATVKDCILRYQSSFTFIDGLIYQNTAYVGYTQVIHEQRREGRSNYNIKALLLLAMNLFFNFSIAPLRFVFISGLLLSVGAGCFAAFILYGKIVGTITFPGYASIMVYFSLLFGALFMFLGLIGEYVGRIAQGVNRAPQFAIRKIKGRK